MYEMAAHRPAFKAFVSSCWLLALLQIFRTSFNLEIIFANLEMIFVSRWIPSLSTWVQILFLTM
jgi:hypothetical protein